jgi:(p)ppGpp synthase/HD superfamily hydrolase
LPFVQIAAILHDVTEDTAFTPDMLLDLGFSEAAVNLIKLLDRDIAEEKWKVFSGITRTEIDKDRFYYDRIKSDPNARMIKLADIEDNLSPWRLSYLSDETQVRLQAKYAKAKEMLG